MFWYNLKITFRGLFRNKLNSFINIFGLAVGMAATILLFLYVQHELSYDKFNTNHKRIYRIVSKIGSEALAICTRLENSTFSNKIPEIETITQLLRGWNPNVEYEKKRFQGLDLKYVDSAFHRVFTQEFIEGNAQTALTQPYSLVINQTTAEKIFGNQNALGKNLLVNEELFTVTGVVRDLPKTSHYSFDILTPLESYKELSMLGGLEFHTYVLFKEGSNLDDGIKKSEKLYGKRLKEGFEVFGKTSCYLQKLTDIHLYSDYTSGLSPGGDIKKVIIYSFLAILILFIAIINFINIMIVQYEGKARDIGMRKAIGASRKNLITQYLSASVILSFISLILGMFLIEITLPYFGQLVGRNIEINYSQNPAILIGLPSLALVVGIISGIYPAFYVSRYKPAQVIKGNLHKQKGTNTLTRGLVIFQFAVSIFLLASLAIFHRQISYMKKADLGFDPYNVIALGNLNKQLKQSYPAIQQELLKHPNIELVSASNHYPGGGFSGQGFYLVGQSEAQMQSVDEYRVQPGYFKTLGIEFIKGRPFDENNPSDKKGIILNEQAWKMLQIEEPVGREVWFHGEKFQIQGIVKDFNYRSLHENITPLMFSSHDSNIRYILVRMKTSDTKQVLDYAKQTLLKFDADYIFAYTFVEDVCRDRYETEERSKNLITSASVLSLLLALLGLYALSVTMVNKRTKEIGIRKINGANTFQIIGLLSKTFTIWFGVAFILAVPFSWYTMNNWLENFAYQINIGFLSFILAGIIAFIFAFATVGWQSLKAANSNPVVSLKYE